MLKTPKSTRLVKSEIFCLPLAFARTSFQISSPVLGNSLASYPSEVVSHLHGDLIFYHTNLAPNQARPLLTLDSKHLTSSFDPSLQLPISQIPVLSALQVTMSTSKQQAASLRQLPSVAHPTLPQTQRAGQPDMFIKM